MLTFASFVPTSPILLPTIGHEHLPKLQKTTDAMKQLAEMLKLSNPSAILCISYPEKISESYVLNTASPYEAHLEKFGDFGTNISQPFEAIFGHQLKEALEKTFPLASEQSPLPYTLATPIALLQDAVQNIPLVSLMVSAQTLQNHFEFGKALREEIIKNSKRIAVLACGDLSHRLTPDSPAGFSPRAEEFDQTVVSFLKSKSSSGIINLPSDILTEVEEQGTKSVSVLLGILETMNYTPEILSYEGPLGIGHLVANFTL
jgi:aromatic ring-opening dioxygenase LigB subunit